MLLHLLLVAASPFFTVVLSQNSDNTPAKTDELAQVDGFVFDGPASGAMSFDGRQGINPTTEFTNTGIGATTPPLPVNEFNTCIASCPVTIEYNPVCGTDNIDYTNPGGLGCAQRCGKEVTLSFYGRCSTSLIRG